MLPFVRNICKGSMEDKRGEKGFDEMSLQHLLSLFPFAQKQFTNHSTTGKENVGINEQQ